MRKQTVLTLVLALAVAAPALAINPGTDVFVPAAARGAGATGTWVTDVFIYNPGSTTANVTVYWLPRGTDNSGAAGTSFTVAPAQTLALDDIIQNTFGMASGGGAIRVTADVTVVVSARIYNTGGASGTFGQGFEGVPASAAITPSTGTDIVGLAHNGTFATNLFAVSTATTQTTVTFELRDTSGAVLASRSYTLPPLASLYVPITDLGGPNFDRGTVHATVSEGSAIVVGSTIDTGSGDPTTMAAWWDCGGGGTTLGVGGVYYGTVKADDGSLGGIELAVNSSGEVVSIDFMFPSTDSQCNYIFGGGGTFETPVPLSDFASGVSFTNSYTGGGDMTWTVVLEETHQGYHLTGTMDATGANWTGGNLGCNGDFPQDSLALGKQPLAP